MVTAKALKPILNGDEVVGYTLRDENGLEMDIDIQRIADAVNKKAINITNLTITEDNKWIIHEDHSESTETSAKTPNSVDLDAPVISRENDKLARMQYLVTVLNNAAKVYEQGTDEVMTNFEYDKLYDELLKLESETGTIIANSPTQKVGYEIVSSLPKKKHETPMLSLDKTKERSALQSFLNGKDGLLSWKLDGLTVVLTYNNGVLEEAVTRGNGEIGEVVTNNARTFVNLPRKISYNGKLVMRGEATISYDDFDKINQSLLPGEDQYKNPRNLCSGSVRQLDSSITAKRHVNWTCFEVVECKGITSNLVSDQFEFVRKLGFDVVENELVTESTILSAIDRFEQKIVSKQMTRPSDGLVLTFNDKAYGQSLGRTSKFPRHSLAFKWQDEEAETTLLDIEWSVGKSGVITPVAIFKPVDIEGSTISRASLHNLSVMMDTLGQPYVGQRIRVYKANMIIPCISWGEKLEDF